MRLGQRHSLAGLIFTIGLFSSAGAPLRAEITPGDWLNRMAAAVQMTSYEGTVIRIQDGKVDVLKVVHAVNDGVIREKVVAQEGNGLEIIRVGNEVHSILPHGKSILVEQWGGQSTLFSTLPSSEIQFGSEYDVAIVRSERVAGRETKLLAIRQHDEYRYGHRIWLDTETSFPLRTQLIDDNGTAIEEVKFAEITLNKEIQASALAPSFNIENFTRVEQSSGHSAPEIETNWTCDELPAGFRAVATHEELMQGSDEMVTHILYSDGLANVSVFIAASSGNMLAGAARLGGSNSFSIEIEEYEITAIGEVPALTVELIASTMRRR
jgi:sigma-E factor negative regulatory protein RseB